MQHCRSSPGCSVAHMTYRQTGHSISPHSFLLSIPPPTSCSSFLSLPLRRPGPHSQACEGSEDCLLWSRSSYMPCGVKSQNSVARPLAQLKPGLLLAWRKGTSGPGSSGALSALQKPGPRFGPPVTGEAPNSVIPIPPRGSGSRGDWAGPRRKLPMPFRTGKRHACGVCGLQRRATFGRVAVRGRTIIGWSYRPTFADRFFGMPLSHLPAPPFSPLPPTVPHTTKQTNMQKPDDKIVACVACGREERRE